MTWIGWFRERTIFVRRNHRLARHLCDMLPASGSVLDVGCGDGHLDQVIHARRPELRVTGVDVMHRADAVIPVVNYDGRTLPFADRSFDIVMMVDVLHHADDPARVLAEAARVARVGIVLKDHFLEGFLAGPTLRFMDWVGNAHHGIAIPANYWTRAQWTAAFAACSLNPVVLDSRLDLYPWPASLWFGRTLHFVSRLESSSPTQRAADA